MKTASPLIALGWNESLEGSFQRHRAGGLIPGRVAVQHRGSYTVCIPEEVTAVITGSARYEALGAEDLPAVGDWVALDNGSGGPFVIRAILERRTTFVRNVAGKQTTEQVIAANIDRVGIVSSLNEDFNLRRIERFIAAVYEGGAEPVVVLTKSDLHVDPLSAIAEVEEMAPGTAVIAVSAHLGEGMEELFSLLQPGKTVVLVGSSGVGKSTLVNALAQEPILEIKEIREDGRGKHTTTFRKLVVLPNLSVVIDTPGMRELQMWGGDLDSAFADVTLLAGACRFNDCRHESEPGCAVRAAIDDGRLPAARLDSYNKLLREISFQEAKTNRAKRLERRQETRRRAREYRDIAWRQH